RFLADVGLAGFFPPDPRLQSRQCRKPRLESDSPFGGFREWSLRATNPAATKQAAGGFHPPSGTLQGNLGSGTQSRVARWIRSCRSCTQKAPDALPQLFSQPEQRAADRVRVHFHLAGDFDGSDLKVVMEVDQAAALVRELIEATPKRVLLFLVEPRDFPVLGQVANMVGKF